MARDIWPEAVKVETVLVMRVGEAAGGMQAVRGRGALLALAGTVGRVWIGGVGYRL